MSMSLDEVVAALGRLSAADKQTVIDEADAVLATRTWTPNPGPQTDAYFSLADEVFYGGQAGGGKSDLLLGLAREEHERSLLLRRTNKEALGLVERMTEVLGTRDGWSSQQGIWRLPARTVEISGCQLETDKQKFKGAPHDLICVGRGTPVLMGDGTFKSVEDVAVGDMVATLEGPRRILRAFQTPVKKAVRLSSGGFSQVQSREHRVLAHDGWVAPGTARVICGWLLALRSNVSRALNPRLYPHPYGKGKRLTSADLSTRAYQVTPVCDQVLFDLEVEEVNHFITSGGFINKNCFDEVSDFTETQYTFIIGWNRSTTPGQRCRIIAAGNPPTRPEGLWVVHRWAAWLDPNHHNPAAPGELRYYTTGENGKEIEVDGPGPHLIGGELVTARSRTFIPAALADNPDLAATDYSSVLASMPEELRAAYRDGRFDMALQDRAYQAIPSAWIRAAQERWTPERPDAIPMCSMGVDASGGGTDPMIIASRFGGWYAPIVKVEAKEIPVERAGAFCAGLVVSHRRDNADIVVDLGGGYGSSMYEQLYANGLAPIGYKGAAEAKGKTLCGKFTFKNARSAAIWRFREALDPGQPGGSVIMLPPSTTLAADLSAPTYEPDAKEIVVESKKKVCERLGRSTDEGDAVIMSWAYGLKQEQIQGGFKNYLHGKRIPNIITGRSLANKRR